MLVTRNIWCAMWKSNNSHISFQSWRSVRGCSHCGILCTSWLICWWPRWCGATTQLIQSPAPLRSVPSAVPGHKAGPCAPLWWRHQLFHTALPPTHGIGIGGGERQMQAPICLTGSSCLLGAPVYQCGLPLVLALKHIQLPFPFASLADPKVPHFRLNIRGRANTLQRLGHQLLYPHTV